MIEPGYYWVRVCAGDEWSVGHFTGMSGWYLMGDAILAPEEPVRSVAEIGPRIEPPVDIALPSYHGWAQQSHLSPGDRFTVDAGDGKVLHWVVPPAPERVYDIRTNTFHDVPDANLPVAAPYSDFYSVGGTIAPLVSTTDQQLTDKG